MCWICAIFAPTKTITTAVKPDLIIKSTMKVFYQHTTEGFSGGVVLIAANDANEARNISMSDDVCKHLTGSLTDVIEADNMAWDGAPGVLPFSSVYFDA